MREIDEQAYKNGGTAFARGTTLRAVVELVATAKPADEEKAFSFALGFADELLRILRHPPAVVNTAPQAPADATGQSVR
jgi:hypothetical protein